MDMQNRTHKWSIRKRLQNLATYLGTWSNFHALSISWVLSSVYRKDFMGIVFSTVSSTTSPGFTPNSL